MSVESNRLGQETSPYLLQHQHNPVHWQAWSAETRGFVNLRLRGHDQNHAMNVGSLAERRDKILDRSERSRQNERS